MKIFAIAASKNEADLYLDGYIESSEWDFVYKREQLLGVDGFVVLLCGQYSRRRDWTKISQTIKTRRCVIAKVL